MEKEMEMGMGMEMTMELAIEMAKEMAKEMAMEMAMEMEMETAMGIETIHTRYCRECSLIRPIFALMLHICSGDMASIESRMLCGKTPKDPINHVTN